MAFEYKKENQEEIKTYFWTILKWYWFIVPAFYFIVILPNITLNEGGASFGGGDVFTLLYQFLNFSMSGLMFVMHPIERSKIGVGDKFLKIATVQQFFTRNIFGVILIILAWYQLPYKVELETIDPEDEEKWYFKPKTILIITIVILSLVLLTML